MHPLFFEIFAKNILSLVIYKHAICSPFCSVVKCIFYFLSIILLHI